MSAEHSSEHQDMLRRLAILEGAALPPAPTPAPTPAPGAPPPASALETIDFTASPAPVGHTVVRSGTNATRRSGPATVEVMAANTLRYEYEHGSSGLLMGVLCEKSRTNLIPNALNPAASFAALGTGVTITANYGTAPSGVASQSTRLVVAAGNTGSGMRYGISGVDLARGVVCWLKCTVARSIYFRSPITNVHENYDVTTAWSPIEIYNADALPGHWYNFDIAENAGTALDIQVWGTGVHEGDTSLNTLVTSGTRPKEVLTINFAASGTFDIQVTFSTGATQNFLSQSVSSTDWAMDADLLNWPVVRSVARFTEGALVASTPGPAPAPAPDPGGFGPNQPIATVARMESCMTGGSDIQAGPMEFPWNTATDGHNYGGYIGDNGSGGFTAAGGTVFRIYPWWVLTGPYNNNPEVDDVRAQVRWMRQWVRTKSGAWIVSKPERLDPAPGTTYEYQFSQGLSYNRVMPSGRQPVVVSSGGRVIEPVVDWAPHGYPFEMLYPDYSLLDCIVIEIQARLTPRRFTNGGFRHATSTLAINCGADNYGNSWVEETMHGGWRKLTNKWQSVYAGTVKRPSGKPNQGPGITLTQFLSNPSPVSTEQNIWIERGAYSASTNTQRLCLRRSAAVTANKNYTMRVDHGAISLINSTVAILAGQSYVMFTVNTPATITGQQCLYITDGATEDIWDTFEIGSGSITE